MDAKTLTRIVNDVLNLSHPNILRTEDVYFDDSNLYMVQEYAG